MVIAVSDTLKTLGLWEIIDKYSWCDHNYGRNAVLDTPKTLMWWPQSRLQTTIENPDVNINFWSRSSAYQCSQLTLSCPCKTNQTGRRSPTHKTDDEQSHRYIYIYIGGGGGIEKCFNVAMAYSFTSFSIFTIH